MRAGYPAAQWVVWADLPWALTNLWPDTSRDSVATSRALMRLQTAFTADPVDVAAVHRALRAATNFCGGLESQARHGWSSWRTALRSDRGSAPSPRQWKGPASVTE